MHCLYPNGISLLVVPNVCPQLLSFSSGFEYSIKIVVAFLLLLIVFIILVQLFLRSFINLAPTLIHAEEAKSHYQLTQDVEEEYVAHADQDNR